MAERKDAKIEFRVEPSLKAAADKLVEREGRPLSDMLRAALVKATGWEGPA